MKLFIALSCFVIAFASLQINAQQSPNNEDDYNGDYSDDDYYGDDYYDDDYYGDYDNYDDNEPEKPLNQDGGHEESNNYTTGTDSVKENDNKLKETPILAPISATTVRPIIRTTKFVPKATAKPKVIPTKRPVAKLNRATSYPNVVHRTTKKPKTQHVKRGQNKVAKTPQKVVRKLQRATKAANVRKPAVRRQTKVVPKPVKGIVKREAVKFKRG